MNALTKWLNTNGYTFKAVTMAGKESKKAIMIDTNYDGQYPPKETYAKHDAIKNRLKRLNLSAEQRGFYTALLVTEN